MGLFNRCKLRLISISLEELKLKPVVQMEPSNPINSSSLKVSFHPEMSNDVHNQQIDKISKKWNGVSKKLLLKSITESAFLWSQKQGTIQLNRSPDEDLQHKQSGKFEESKTGGNNFQLSPSTIKPPLLEEHQTGTFEIAYELDETMAEAKQHSNVLNPNAPSFHLKPNNFPLSAFSFHLKENSDQNSVDFNYEYDLNAAQNLEDIPLNDAENEAEPAQQVNNPEGNPQNPSSKRYIKAFVVGTLAISILAIFSHKRYGTISPRGVWKKIRSPQPPIKAKI